MRRRIYVLQALSKVITDATTDFLKRDHRTSEAPQCPACGDPVGMLRWEPPYRVEIETWGSRFGDLAFGTGHEFLVSERFARLWRREGLTGLENFRPAEIVKVIHRGRRIKASPPRYLVVRVYRSSRVVLDDVRSGVKWTRPPTCDVCKGGIREGYDRIVVKGIPETNIFIARGLPGRYLVDQRFKRFAEEHGMTNCPLGPAERESWHPFGK